VTHLGGGIDEFKVDLFEGGSGDLRNQRLSQHENSLLGSDDTSLHHEEVISDDTVVGETSQRSDVLISQVSVGGGVVGNTRNGGLSDSVHLLVHFGSVMVTHLTGSGDGESNSGRVPRSDATNFSVTSVGLLLEMLDAVSLNHTLETFTLGNTNNINHFVLIEDGVNLDFLFEMAIGEINLLGGGSSVNLDFEDVILLLSQLGEGLHLGGNNSSDHSAVLSNSVEIDINGFFLLFVLLGVFGESFLLGIHPVLVESSHGVSVQLLGPDGREGSKSSGGFDVTDESDHNNGGSFQDGHGFDDFLLVQFGTGFFDVSHDVGHTGLETSESGEMARLLGVVLGE
jgi:hypothetical protein